MSFFKNIINFLCSEHCICCRNNFDLSEQEGGYKLSDIIDIVISRYDSNYLTYSKIIYSEIFKNKLNIEEASKGIIHSDAIKDYFICANCYKHVSEFDEKYKNTLINKSKVKLYNTYYNKDFSYLKGDCFSYDIYRLPKAVIYDKVRFLTAYYGYDIAYNVVYDNDKVTGVMAKNIR